MTQQTDQQTSSITSPTSPTNPLSTAVLSAMRQRMRTISYQQRDAERMRARADRRSVLPLSLRCVNHPHLIHGTSEFVGRPATGLDFNRQPLCSDCIAAQWSAQIDLCNWIHYPTLASYRAECAARMDGGQ